METITNSSFTCSEYAEYIEQRLKNLGLIVDLLFPNDDVPIGKVLANISSRGCLYAILVMPQNEEHRSLTLNVLHGVPQGICFIISFIEVLKKSCYFFRTQEHAIGRRFDINNEKF